MRFIPACAALARLRQLAWVRRDRTGPPFPKAGPAVFPYGRGTVEARPRRGLVPRAWGVRRGFSKLAPRALANRGGHV
jgi:hypothetical protein